MVLRLRYVLWVTVGDCFAVFAFVWGFVLFDFIRGFCFLDCILFCFVVLSFDLMLFNFTGFDLAWV